MRWIFPFFLFLFHNTNAQLIELFDDKDFLSNPEWVGTGTKFEIDALGKLHLKAPAEASDAWLFTQSAVAEDAVWEMDVAMLFDPSSQNYCRVYLMSDNADPAMAKNGFYVVLGGTDDDISLFQLTNGISQRLIDGANGRLAAASVSLRLRATYSSAHGWEVLSNFNGNWISEGSNVATHQVASKWFGVYCRYSSTRSDKFYFDNIAISGLPLQDRSKPCLLNAKALTATQVLLTFSEPLNTTSFSPQSVTFNPNSNTVKDLLFSANRDSSTLILTYPLADDFSGTLKIASFTDVTGNPSGDTTVLLTYSRIRCSGVKVLTNNTVRIVFSKPIDPMCATSHHFGLDNSVLIPVVVVLVDSKTLDIKFDNSFANKASYFLKFNSVTDTNGDEMTQNGIGFNYVVPVRHDIVFSEIMSDPDPVNGLPSSEYVELRNNTLFDIDLTGFTLMVANKKYALASGLIKSGKEMLLVAANDTALWDGYPNLLPLKSFPTLPNSEGKLVLFSSQNTVIDAVEYNRLWKDGSFKDDCGWSFERVDMFNFSHVNNWVYSTNLQGGTPGLPNSVDAHNPDTQNPQINIVEVLDSKTLELHFSEPINPKSLSKEVFKSITMDVSSVSVDTLFCMRATVDLGKEMEAMVVYQFELPVGITDFAGNSLNAFFPLQFGGPLTPDSLDVVINEVMFNPISGKSDFVEIFNRSNKPLLLSDLHLASIRNGVLERLSKITDYKIPFLPNSYWVITDNALPLLADCKSPWWMVESLVLPSMPDDAGDVGLSLSNGRLVDRLSYSSDWHFQLLGTTEGVSLERISANGSTQDPNNWQSASATYGFSSPTAPNSQSLTIDRPTQNHISLSTDLFTPDGDGVDDFLMIGIAGAQDGGTVSIKIFNSRMQEVKTIANNELVGAASQFKWDGTNDGHSRVAPGIYLVWCRIFYASGQVEEQKKACVLGVTAK